MGSKGFGLRLRGKYVLYDHHRLEFGARSRIILRGVERLYTDLREAELLQLLIAGEGPRQSIEVSCIQVPCGPSSGSLGCRQVIASFLLPGLGQLLLKESTLSLGNNPTVNLLRPSLLQVACQQTPSTHLRRYQVPNTLLILASETVCHQIGVLGPFRWCSRGGWWSGCKRSSSRIGH